ncbi:ANTAR domain-containing response regulator [Candidatus Colwellia aromaticivorans]|uniref:ANTAR domain-containing response regulator n=1 Tax=Candidatus Colwellia aromaticivorans TaxID=2267621 RepID=UPI000DF3C33A|nr:ANTAR domain-containing protein [Candidatus Colwellia aromaticivorans]
MTSNYPLYKTKSNNQQNSISSSKPISVLLIEEKQTSSSALKKALIDFDFKIAKQLSFDDNIIKEIESCNPSILILATDVPTDKTLKVLAEINQLLPLPIIIFAENDSPNVIKKAIKAGVSAYVVHEVLPQRINSIISVANERFKEVQVLRDELKHTKNQLEARKHIERAKGYIMQQKQISENAAYSDLRKMAMDQGSPIATVAKNIIDVCELLSSPKLNNDGAF